MSTNKKPKLLFLVTEDWYFCSHRLPLARAARKAGYQVSVATHIRKHAETIRREGFKLIPIRMSRENRGLLFEISCILEILKIYRAERPDVVHHVAVKPVLYGSIAALIARPPHIINAFAGLGYVFISDHLKAKFIKACILPAFKVLLNGKNRKVILQNPDDLLTLLKSGVIRAENTVLIKGSGVDVQRYSPTTGKEDIPIVLLASRLLWDKGVGEFFEASRTLRENGVRARFVLVGDIDADNPAHIPLEQIQNWQNSGHLEWWGHQEHMPDIYAQAHIACLPSYREGLPKSLLEAASCGIPIVTTDTPGCREIVRNGENGITVPIRDSRSLAVALHRLIENSELRRMMGKKGRDIVLEEFSENKIVSETLDLYRTMIYQKRSIVDPKLSK